MVPQIFQTCPDNIPRNLQKFSPKPPQISHWCPKDIPSMSQQSPLNLPDVVLKYVSGVKTEEIRKGRILGGVQGYLEGIFEDPSLTQILGKTHKNLRKTKKNLRQTKKNTFDIIFP